MRTRVLNNPAQKVQKTKKTGAKFPQVERTFNLRRNAFEAILSEANRFAALDEDCPPDESAKGGSSSTSCPPPINICYRADDLLYMRERCDPINFIGHLDSKRVSSCGYFARGRDDSNQVYSGGNLPLNDLLRLYRRLGFTYISWNGITSRPLLDRDGRIFAVLAGRPGDCEYAEACSGAFEAINAEGDEAQFEPRHLYHKRGDFPAVNVGVTHGKGTTEPKNLQNYDLDDGMDRLLRNPALERISSFQDAAFKLWAPNLHAHYSTQLTKIWKADEKLRPGFANSPWPCTAINFGRRVFTNPHRDCKNLSFGWCSIVALGAFDPRKGGHLVLPELRMVIEFPSGSNILIPSAILTHCNIPIGVDEERLSFTQFCAGELFRYADCGLQTEKELRAGDLEQYKRHCSEKKNRWMGGIELYDKMRRRQIC